MNHEIKQLLKAAFRLSRVIAYFLKDPTWISLAIALLEVIELSYQYYKGQ